jgi:DNA-binding NarL/FixJ family response regulator
VKSVVIVEDLLLLRDGLTRLLSMNGFEIAAAVDTGAAFLEAVEARRPDVAVVDVRLPPTFTDEGLRAAIEARRRRSGFPVLILSQYVEQLYARELLSDGGGRRRLPAQGPGRRTSASSSRRCNGWPTAGPRWTPR